MSYDERLLNQIKAAASEPPYYGAPGARSLLILDTELRTSSALTSFLVDGGVKFLQPCCDLTHRPKGIGKGGQHCVLQFHSHGACTGERALHAA
jgi:hypothetical protein